VKATGRPRRAGGPAAPRAQAASGLGDGPGLACAEALLEFAALDPARAVDRVSGRPAGLSEAEASARLDLHGLNDLPAVAQPGWRARALAAVGDPFVVLLLALDGVLAVTGDRLGVGVLSAMVVTTVGLRLRHERRYGQLVAALRNLAAARVRVRRATSTAAPSHAGSFHIRELNPRLLVPGDVVVLGPGDVVPADCRILTADGFSLDQSALTGESMPAAKAVRADVGRDVLAASTLCLTGATVSTGAATAVVLRTGGHTILGATATQVGGPRTSSAAERELGRVTWLLVRLLAVLAPTAFAVTVLTHAREGWQTAGLFAVAVGVGLVPEMLTVILALAQGRGLSALAGAGVVVTRPAAVQDLGAMTVLAMDKTGTLTSGRPTLVRRLGPDGRDADAVLEYAALAALFGAADPDALETAILDQVPALDQQLLLAQYDKVAELPFAAGRRRASVVLDPGAGTHLLVTKGAVTDVLAACTGVDAGDGMRRLDPGSRAEVDRACRRLWRAGHRVLAVAYRVLDPAGEAPALVTDDADLVFVGLLAFDDPVKSTSAAAVADLTAFGVRVVVMTGDAPGTARAVADSVGLPSRGLLTGAAIDALDDAELVRRARTVAVFAEMGPLHKVRVVGALRAGGDVVGFVGDGVNDTAALRAADVGIAVDEAAGVARHASDAVIVAGDLPALGPAVRHARHAGRAVTTYLTATISTNLGNVLSILCAAVALPFLPMLPGQLVAQNICYDLVQLALPWDRVDPEQIRRPHRLTIRGLLRFVCWFAPVGTAFDLATFAVLWWLTSGDALRDPMFRTGWFVVNLTTQILAVQVIRTGRTPLIDGRPSLPVAGLAVAGCLFAVAIPGTRWGAALGLSPLPVSWLGVLGLVAIGYVAVLQLTKRVYSGLTGRWPLDRAQAGPFG
jgi:Mg2+-importing ATPase